MGEAKRRKQLGLMPTVFPFRAELTRSGEVRLLASPEDPEQRRLIEKGLRDSQALGPAWDAEYRTVRVLTDRSGARYETAEDLARFPVPDLRRLDGELALPSGPGREERREREDPDRDAVIPLPGGGRLRLREQKHSFDGERWESLPPLRDPQHVLLAFEAHPAFRLEGEVLGQFQADHWREGRIDLTPDLGPLDPSGEVLEFVEELLRDLHGETPEAWAERHEEMLEAQAEAEAEGDDDSHPAPPAGVPSARRTFFELRRSAPLQSPLMATAYFRDLELYLLDGPAYTLDGETWHPYEDPDAELGGGGLAPELAEFFDLNMISVTVHEDGRVEWDEDEELSEAEMGQLRRDLTEATGAGDPQAWAEWNRTMLQEVLGPELSVPEGAELPVPVAVRLDIPRDVLGDDSPLSQTYMESEVSFDGETWRDLYSEEVPEELLAFAAGQGGN